jgi:hypothetical protein
MDREYAKKLARSTMVSPYLRASTAETGAQVIILGHNHLDKVGLNISCLHRTKTVMDCFNDTATGAMGVFFGCVRGKSAATGKMLVHRGMVYVIERRIMMAMTELR